MAEGSSERPRGRLSRLTGQAGEFARDSLWLVGWGAGRLGATARRRSTPENVRGCVGCLGSLLLAVSAAALWRRRGR